MRHLLLQALQDAFRFGLLPVFRIDVQREQIGLNLVDGRVVLDLLANAHRLGERLVALAFDLAHELRRDVLLLDGQLLPAGGRLELVNRRDELLDGHVRRIERADDLLFRDFLCARFYHQDAIGAAGDDEVERALLALGVGWVDDEGAVHNADADAGDRLLERNLRQRQRRRGAGDGEDVGIVVLVRRQEQRDDLRFIAPARREQRTARTIDQAAGEHFLFRRFALALEEAAGDAPRGVGVLAVIHGQREEVDPFPRAGRVAGGHEDDRVARSDDDGTVCLLGQLAGFEGNGAGSNPDLALLKFDVVHKS